MKIKLNNMETIFTEMFWWYIDSHNNIVGLIMWFIVFTAIGFACYTPILSIIPIFVYFIANNTLKGE